MPTCGTQNKSQVWEPWCYSLKPLATSRTPGNFKELEQWLTEDARQPDWDGKMYVASTIHWDCDTREFLQTGCSPNYMARWWSLACCKHDMRTARPFRSKAIDLLIPTYVFTLGRLDSKLGQPLVSIAQVTKYSFDTMDQYIQFLLKRGDRALISSRSTRARRNDGVLGWRFGDCHADFSGNVDEPHQGHVHYADKSWKTDINGRHMILVSDRFLLWPKPSFMAIKTQKQSRYGVDIDNGKLRTLLKIR